VSQKQRSKLSAVTSRQKLRLATGTMDETLGHRVRRWCHHGVRDRSLKTIYGIFLLPVAWIFSQTFFTTFWKATLFHGIWELEEFGMFTVGALGWVLAFIGGLWITGGVWPLHVYVLGHELTHAVWVWFSRGEVLDKQLWSDQGGYIVTDTHNFWIALTPYFYPIYSLIVVFCYSVASIFCDVAHSPATFLLLTPNQWLFLLLGLTWAFHITFTIWMIPKGQSDLTTHGTFFSLVVIYLMNLLVLTVSLLVVAPDLSFAGYGNHLFANAENFSEWACKIFRAVWVKATR